MKSGVTPIDTHWNVFLMEYIKIFMKKGDRIKTVCPPFKSYLR